MIQKIKVKQNDTQTSLGVNESGCRIEGVMMKKFVTIVAFILYALLQTQPSHAGMLSGSFDFDFSINSTETETKMIFFNALIVPITNYYEILPETYIYDDLLVSKESDAKSYIGGVGWFDFN